MIRTEVDTLSFAAPTYVQVKRTALGSKVYEAKEVSLMMVFNEHIK
ncbi:hypothetical protein VCRA2123O444_20384 [Vibrio crassostreae]|nr:hypothetical protein VCRA2118O429_10043 [Vibrio crassostreae]CAK1962797.1 hypothetical protein VCRA2113O416_20044 [Vibrio crassostreae]CAK2148203.1 hypothetical protein VCRA2113O412_60044 [Vibrio crassostreae]CAK2149245.1 hypothetical protein VCRA2113O414_60044 [Vibrio crassostreae]CAK2158948.1 hypothetical protein VCRA2113O409_60155 [Vibrio crassostreae]